MSTDHCADCNFDCNAIDCPYSNITDVGFEVEEECLQKALGVEVIPLDEEQD